MIRLYLCVQHRVLNVHQLIYIAMSPLDDIGDILSYIEVIVRIRASPNRIGAFMARCSSLSAVLRVAEGF